MLIKSRDYQFNRANTTEIVGYILTQPKTVYNKSRGETRLYFALASAKPSKFAMGKSKVRHDAFLCMVEQRPDPEFLERIAKDFKKDDLIYIKGHLTNEFIAKPHYFNEQLKDNRGIIKALNFFQTRILIKNIKKLTKSKQQLLDEKRFRRQFEYQLRGYNIKFESGAFDKDDYGVELSELDKLID